MLQTLIHDSKALMIWAGQGVLMAEATEELKELAELLSVPVYTSMPGKSAFDERHDLSLGAGSQTTTLAAKEFLQSSDTILALGTSLTATPYAQDIPPGKRIIQNVDNPDDIDKDISLLKSRINWRYKRNNKFTNRRFKRTLWYFKNG